MFDISAYARPGGDANFASTLKPAADLFTDQNGVAVTTFLPLGPTTAAPATAASIVLAPGSATNVTGTSQTLTATVRTSNNQPVANALVFFTIGSGPNANAGGPVVTDSNGVATFTYDDGLGPGVDAVQASIGAVQSNVAQITWQGAGPFDHIAIAPASATIAAGGSQAYTAVALDKFGTSLGDVTASTVFSVGPDGSCTAASCTATAAGLHTVTGSYSGKTATAGLTVTAGALDHIAVAPASATIAAGGSQAYTAQGFDVYNNSVGDVTSATTFSITPDGTCTGASCTASIAGPHTVTGNDGGFTATAALTVTGVTATPYTFSGFFQPIDMSASSGTVWNVLKAGQAVPVKWQLLLNGVPVSDPASFAGLWSAPVPCSSSSSTDDPVEEVAIGNSGLQYNGGGVWQYNWATGAGYKGTCRAIAVKFKDGTTSPLAYFKFK